MLLCSISFTVKLTLFPKKHIPGLTTMKSQKGGSIKAAFGIGAAGSWATQLSVRWRVRFKAAEKLALRSSVERRLPSTPSRKHRYCTHTHLTHSLTDRIIVLRIREEQLHVSYTCSDILLHKILVKKLSLFFIKNN